MTQGDSGGPLTTVNVEGAHVLVGIVSKRLGESCSQQDYTVFTSVSALLPWIESSIKENGGMASCGFNFSAPPTLGILLHFPSIQVRITFSQSIPTRIISIINEKTTNIMLRNIIGASTSTWTSHSWRSINRRTTHLH